jgi:hypothetical protein
VPVAVVAALPVGAWAGAALSGRSQLVAAGVPRRLLYGAPPLAAACCAGCCAQCDLQAQAAGERMWMAGAAWRLLTEARWASVMSVALGGSAIWAAGAGGCCAGCASGCSGQVRMIEATVLGCIRQGQGLLQRAAAAGT